MRSRRLAGRFIALADVVVAGVGLPVIGHRAGGRVIGATFSPEDFEPIGHSTVVVCTSFTCDFPKIGNSTNIILSRPKNSWMVPPIGKIAK